MANDSKFNLTITINGKEVANTLNGVGKEIRTLKGQLRNLNESDPKFKEKQKELEKARERYGELKTEIDGANTSLDEARGHWDNLMSGFLSGNVSQAKAGIEGLTGNLKNAAKSAWAFIATPIGAFITGLVAIGAATKAWFDYNVEIAKSVKLTEQLTGFEGDQLVNFRASIQATADTFDKEFNEVLRSANALSKQMKISQEEALDLINQGFVRGADASGDFLKKLEEYPIQFKNAGYTAQDFIDIATQEVKGGIYDDKLIDAIKEANLSLQEMTKTQEDALKNAFGSKFTNEIARGLKFGEISTKQALEKIIDKSNELGLNYQQQQQLISDLFKGAGEDAGGFAEIILQLNEAFKEENKTLNENEQATQNLVEANIANEKALADLFDASQSGFPAMLTNLKSIGTEISTGILVGLKNMFTSIEELKKQAGMEGTANAVKDISENIKEFGTTAQEETGYMIDSSVKNVARLKKELDNVSFFSFGKEDALKKQLAKEEAYLNELKLIAEDKSAAFVDYQQKLEEESKIKVVEDKGGAGEDEESEKKNAAYKKLLDAKQKLYDKAEQELNALIKKQQEERLAKTKQGIEKELAAIDAKYDKLKEKYVLTEEEKTNLTLAEIETRENQIRELEDLKRLEKEDLEVQRDAEYKERLALIEEENKLLAEEAKLEREAEEAATEEQRIQLLLDKTRYIALEQLRIEEEAAIKKLKLANATEAEIAAIKEKFALKIAKVEDAFTKGKTKADEQAAINEQQVISTRRQAYADMFGNIAQLLGEHTAAGKAAAIAQATINTWQGVTEVWKAPAVLPEPFNTISKVAASGVTIASGLKAVGAIKSTNTGFYEGGPTGDSAIYNDEYGAVTGVVHDNEWVAPKWMNESPRYAPTLRWLESERVTKKPFFNGGSTSPDAMSRSETDAPVAGEVSNTMLIQILQKLDAKLDQGFKGYIVRDLEEYQRAKELDDEYEQLLNNTKL